MRILVNGVKLFFDVEGQGLVASGPNMVSRQTVILIHGGPGADHTSFKPEYGQLAEAAQLVYLDLRGNGRSDRGSVQDWNLRQWAADLHAFCSALEITSPVLLGQSFGCEVVMQYAVSYPEAMSKLILLSPTAKLRLDRALAVFERLAGREIRDIAERYWKHPTPELHAEYMRVCASLYTTKPVHADVYKRATFYDDVARHYNGREASICNFLPLLHRVKVPTLILSGSDDPITTIEDAEDIARSLPPGGATFCRLEGYRHGPVRECPEVSLGVMRAFLKGEPIPFKTPIEAKSA